MPAEMEVSETVCTSGCPSVTGQRAKPKKAEFDVAAHWEVKDSAAFRVYSSETVSPGSHFGSDVSQQALTFKYYAQLGKANKHGRRSGLSDRKAGAENHCECERWKVLFKSKLMPLFPKHTKHTEWELCLRPKFTVSSQAVSFHFLIGDMPFVQYIKLEL